MAKDSFFHKLRKTIGWPILLAIIVLSIMVINTNLSCSNKDETYKAKTNPALITAGVLLGLSGLIVVGDLVELGMGDSKGSFSINNALSLFGKMLR
jgi:hypothetical protein